MVPNTCSVNSYLALAKMFYKKYIILLLGKICRYSVGIYSPHIEEIELRALVLILNELNNYIT